MNRKLFAFAAITLLALCAIAPAMADSLDQVMNLSVKGQPVEIPGRVLEPGKYVLRFVDDEHHFVEIQMAGGAQVGMYQVVPISRAVRKDNVQLVVAKQAGSVPELTAFFYPDAKTGYKFLYPKSQSIEAAKTVANNSSQGR